MIISNIIWARVKFSNEVWENCFIRFKDEMITIIKKSDDSQVRTFGGAKCTMLVPWGANFSCFNFDATGNKNPIQVEAEF